jgi:hypothetical protein
MKKYWSEGGRSNPDFRYKVKVSYPLTGMIDWCDNYPTKRPDGYFERYYIQFSTRDSNDVIFQFEQEEPAIMFTLMFAK